jgi:hypothetical protein
MPDRGSFMRIIGVCCVFVLMLSYSGCKESPTVIKQEKSIEKYVLKQIETKGVNYTNFKSVVTDSSGAVYVAGHAILGLKNPKYRALLVKYDRNAKKVWEKILGSDKQPISLYEMIIHDNKLYVVGSSGESMNYDALIMKFDTHGKKLWSKTFGGSEYDFFKDVVVSKEGFIFAVGYSHSDDNEITMGNRGGKDALMVKFDQRGKKIWDKSFGSSVDDTFNAISIDKENNLYVVGSIGMRCNDFPRTQNTGRNDEAIVAKFTVDGEMLWSQLIGSQDDDSFNDIVVNEDGLYAVGRMGVDDVLFKLDVNGKKVWDTKVGTHFGEYHKVISQKGTLYTMGYQNNIVKFSSSGEKLWQRVLGNEHSEYFYDIAVAPENSMYAVGVQINPKELPPGAFCGVGEEYHGAVMTKFSDNGQFLWGYAIDADR